MKYVLKVSYDGAPFYGFQRQPKQKTVQGQIEKALSEIFDENIRIVGAGRTDTGVHGIGQVIAFESNKKRTLGAIIEGTNSKIGDHICVSQASLLPADSDFHPRFHALSRTYHYYVLGNCQRAAPIHWSPRLWCIGEVLDLNKVREAGKSLLGEHDFSTFSFQSEVHHHRRTMLACDILEMPDNPFLPGTLLCLKITANGFLRKQIRLVTAALVEVGLGLRTKENLMTMLEAKDPTKAPHPAPCSGLYFASVQFDPSPFSVEGLALETETAKAELGLRFKP